MFLNEIIQSQYHAALVMLRQTVEKCPDPLWLDASYTNPAWHVAYHVLYYTHLYLQPTADGFIPWEMHRDDLGGLENSDPSLAYRKGEILKYLDFCLGQVDEQVRSVNLEAESGFDWLPFSKLELQIYNIRHIQHHTAELSERIGAHDGVDFPWVKMKG